MKVVGNRLMIRQLKSKDSTEGGLALPEQSIYKLPCGPIVQIGGDIRDFKVGDVVLFSSIGVIDLAPLVEGCILIEPEDVLGILEKGEY